MNKPWLLTLFVGLGIFVVFVTTLLAWFVYHLVRTPAAMPQ